MFAPVLDLPQAGQGVYEVDLGVEAGCRDRNAPQGLAQADDNRTGSVRSAGTRCAGVTV